MAILWLDFETRSRCDLLTHGVYNYALDSSTELLCMSYAFDDEDVQTWIPTQEFPERINQHVKQGSMLYAHNAAFERLIYGILRDDFNAAYPKLEQWYCTAAQARSNCAPGSLEDVGRFYSSKMRKDYRGAQLIRLLCIPRPDGNFHEDAVLFKELVEYCEQDVRTMRALSNMMRPLTAIELQDYHINERINDRGLLVDTELAKAAMQYAIQETREIEELVLDITGGEVPTVRSPKMRQWVQQRVGPEALKLMTVYKDGEKKYSIDKSTRTNLLVLAEEAPDEVPPEVADVIQCADDLWASSIAKFARMANIADFEDQRVRGAFVFAGGAATGRAASYGIQLHNLTRNCFDVPEVVRETMLVNSPLVPTHGKRVTEVLKKMLRPTIMAAPSCKLIVADWAGIEARITPWITGSELAQPKLTQFALNEDVYVTNAAATYRVKKEDVTKEQRMVGKVQELACGFAGGAGAFHAMAKIYGLYMTDHEARRMVEGWRNANPWAKPFWTRLQNAYRQALLCPHHEINIGRVTYMFDTQHLWYALPSGRVLCYPFIRVEGDDVTYAKAAWKPSADATEWPRARLWVGVAIENIVQATAHDLLREALRACALNGLNVIGHVHDEIVLEENIDMIEARKELLQSIMITPPNWASGLPLAISLNVSERYGK